MKIQVTKNLKVQLLKSLETGYIDTDLFPGMIDTIDLSCLPTAELILRAKTIHELPRTLTKEEARELWNDFDNGKFPIPKNQ